MIKIKLYEYDSTQEENGYRGKDYSTNLMLGETITDDLSEVMGTAELTLAGLNFSEEFSPKTKFIIDAIDTNINETEPIFTWHMEVQEDVVSQPILSDNSYYDHHITLIEAGVDAQGRMVDNIAITYKLQDVTLDGENVVDINKKVSPVFNILTARPMGTYDLFEVDYSGDSQMTIGKKLRWEFATWFSAGNPNRGERTEWTDFKYYQGIAQEDTVKEINLPVPMLEIQNGVNNTNTFAHMGYCSVRTVVTEFDLRTNAITTVLDQITNPCPTQVSHEKWTDDWVASELPTISPSDLQKGQIVAEVGLFSIPFSPAAGTQPRVQTVASIENNVTHRRIIFNARKNCKYTINTFLKDNFTYNWNQEAQYRFFFWNVPQGKKQVTTNNNPLASMEFITYELGEDTRVFLKTAPEENAYELFQKAQINTQNVIKQQGIPITETPQSYYLGSVIAGGTETDAKLTLQNTTIVENFYNQKNWWELLLEIGKYIHSIPKVEFGEDNRYVVNWYKLGQTNQIEDNGTKSTKVSIFNSKSVENYVSACSSYITNMVQLGGVIDEWVAPKSSSEDYLVYNDVAEIHTSKPIIEIVSMEAKCINPSNYDIGIGGNIASLTPSDDNGYIFEENVYNILSIEMISTGGLIPQYIPKEKVNKGLAIYYKLGTNIIQGLNYRLPAVSSGNKWNDYAIKQILGTIFMINIDNWNQIKVNDFQFHIVYRTKDTARSDQTRPDLRKYLLASKYDRAPQNYQFNNQQDVVIDSTKFGNNIYGKLIRTGNSNYTITEWHDSLYNLKQVGELYNIRDELYYVSTVSNTFNAEHVVSEVTFSKDYNQLSEIIGIPSEPRFYEISEQSLIEREVPFNDYIVLGTKIESTNNPLSFIRNKGWNYINKLLFRSEDSFPKYAITIFKNDIDKTGDNVVGNGSFYKDVCHPISTYSIQNTLTLEWDMVDNFSAGDRVKPTTYVKNNQFQVDTAYNELTPIQYTDPHGRSDLVDFMIMDNLGELNKNQVFMFPDSPYRTRFPEYTTFIGEDDVTTWDEENPDTALNSFVQTQVGRQPQNGDGVIVQLTTTLDNEEQITYYFYLYRNNEWQENKIQSYNKEEFTKPYIGNRSSDYLFGNEPLETLGDNEHGLGLMKDNREAIHFNYNLQMISDSDRFVISAWLWQPNKGTLRLALLNQEINKISNETIPQDSIIDDSRIIYSGIQSVTATTVDETNGTITIPISTLLDGVDLTDVKAIAIISDTIVASDTTSGARYFVMGRNITGLDTSDITGTLTPEQAKEKAKADWYISNYDKSMFPHQ